jgi:hypothetical protein
MRAQWAVGVSFLGGGGRYLDLKKKVFNAGLALLLKEKEFRRIWSLCTHFP